MGRRQLLRAVAVAGLAGTTAGPPVHAAFAAQVNDSGKETRTFRGQFGPEVPDWAYLPVEVPSGVREIAVRYTYNKPPTPPGVRGNALDIGIFDADGHDLGDAAGFRGWSGGAREQFTINEHQDDGYLRA